MAFTLPEGLHQDLYPLAWLVGTWRGKGQGEYPSTKPFLFEGKRRMVNSALLRSWLLEQEWTA